MHEQGEPTERDVWAPQSVATRPTSDVQWALAEFSALRAEILTRIATQSSLITLVVTAIGIVAGLVIAHNGDVRLLLILPFLVSAAGIHYAEQTRAIAMIGSYIRDALWPYLTDLLGDPPPSWSQRPSWESVANDFRTPHQYRRKRDYLSFLLLSGVPGALIFGVGGAVPLVVLQFVDGAIPSGIVDTPDVYRGIWWLGALFTLIYAVLAVSASSLSRPLWQTLKGYAG